TGRKTQAYRAVQRSSSCGYQINKRSFQHGSSLPLCWVEKKEVAHTPLLLFAYQPGGQVISRPESTWKCRWNTLCPACSPILETTRKLSSPMSFAIFAITSKQCATTAL